MTIRCDRICLRDGGRDILRALSLDIPFGGPLSIVGPAGAGKSALFRVLAGQLRPYAGRLQVHGREVALDGSRNSQVALVDVRSTNYPGFTVWENIAVPLRMARSKLLEEQVITLAHAVGLGDCLSLMPADLSLVGQRRLALARALASRPALLLLDDPLAGLPDVEAIHMLEDLPSICTTAWQQGMAVAVATRSSQVALALGGATAVVAQGRLQQQEVRAIDVLLHPVSLNVARVFGDPPINLLRATAGDLAFPARVERVECGLAGTRIECRARVGALTALVASLLRPALGETVVLHADPGALYLFDGAGALVQQVERAAERAQRRPQVVPVPPDMPVTEAAPTIFALR